MGGTVAALRVVSGLLIGSALVRRRQSRVAAARSRFVALAKRSQHGMLATGRGGDARGTPHEPRAPFARFSATLCQLTIDCVYGARIIRPAFS